jgi:protein SCO1/2
MTCLAIKRSARFTVVWLLLGLLLLLSSCSSEIQQDPRDFLLQSQSGMVSLSDFRGQVVLLFFGYTHCPDVCPATMNNIATALHQLADDERANVQVLFVTVDPQRDSLEYLSEYLRFFQANIIGLSGTPEQIHQAAKAYEVGYFRQGTENNPDYQMLHSSKLFLINAEGKLSDIMGYKTASEDIAATLRQWLNPPIAG